VIVLTLLFYGIEVHFIAAFHDAIAGAVPQIVELFKNKDPDVIFAGEDIIIRLLEHGR